MHVFVHVFNNFICKRFVVVCFHVMIYNNSVIMKLCFTEILQGEIWYYISFCFFSDRKVCPYLFEIYNVKKLQTVYFMHKNYEKMYWLRKKIFYYSSAPLKIKQIILC